jgi:hypothetical protein
VSATVIGSGMANTTTADATCRADAIQIAADYANNGKSDWHLPSKDELNELYKNHKYVGLKDYYYWSSSEYTATAAWVQGFDPRTGEITQSNPVDTYKLYTHRVRLVRAFGTTATTTTTTTTTAVPGSTCATGGVCAVGDIGPGGGKVFYVHPGGSTFASTGSDCGSTCRYLEVAPTNGEKVLMWATDVNSNQSTAVSGADATVIGSGYQNTLDIKNQTGNVAASSAAVFAFEYSHNGKSDWHLPSKDELNELFKQRDTVVFFAGNFVWSSSEYRNFSAWIQNFSQGYQGAPPKEDIHRVRPVRAF